MTEDDRMYQHDEERSVIGGVMTSYTCDEPGPAAVAFAMLTPDDFMFNEHRAVWGAMLELKVAGDGIDELGVMKRFREDGVTWPGVSPEAPDEYHGMGPIQYLAALDSMCCANIAHHAKTLRELRGRSELEDMGRQIALTATRGEFAGSVVAQAQQIQELVAYSGASGMQSPKDACKAYVEARKSATRGLKYGWAELDASVGRMTPGQFVMVAGRPSMGKSVFALNVAVANAKEGHRVAVFSLEMPTEELMARMVAAEMGMYLSKAMSPDTKDGWARVATGLDRIRGWPFAMCDVSGLSAGQLEARIRQEHARQPFDLAIVDYLQLMTPADRKVSREQQVAGLSSALKNMARSLEIPLLCVCQLNRGPDSRGGEERRPRLSDFRESGSIEQDIDVAIMLYREGYYDKNADPEDAEILVRKQRNGEQCMVKLRFQGQFARFVQAS